MSKAQPYKDFGEMSKSFFSNFHTIKKAADKRKKILKKLQEENK